MDEVLYLQNPWWEGSEIRSGITRRNLLDNLIELTNKNRLTMVLGGRRVGKTTLLMQYINHLLENGVDRSRICYLLMDTHVFNNSTITQLISNYRKIHNLNINDDIFLILDEIQYKDDWEQEVKNIYDTQSNVKVILSGSASFKIHIKTSFLTGRYNLMYIYPLSFKEWLEFQDINIKVTESYKYQSLLENYLKTGGYPEYVLNQDPQYFSNLIDSLVFKDFVEYYNIKNLDLVKNLFGLLADRTGSHSSYTKLANILDVSKETIREYISALKGIYSIYELSRFSTTRNERIYFPKKFYVNDNGFLFNLTGRFNKGYALERSVFDHLNKKYGEELFFYYSDGKEVDFYINGSGKKVLIEAKFINDLKDFNYKNYVKILNEVGLRDITFITDSVNEVYKVDDKELYFIPAWKFFLDIE